MRETGYIISVSGKTATIQLNRGDRCDGCQLCSSFGDNAMKVDALNKIGAKVGDLVEVDVEPKEIVKSSFIVFIFPIFMMIAGYFVGVRFIPPHSEGTGVVVSLLALVISFFLIRLADNRRNPEELTPAVIVDFSKQNQLM